MTAVHPRPSMNIAKVTVYWFDGDHQLRRDRSARPVDVGDLFADATDATGAQSRPIQDGSGTIIGIATRTPYLNGF